MSEISEMTNCPNCPNHCPRNSLRCGKGRAFFAQEDTDNKQPARGEDHSDFNRDHGHRRGFTESESANPLVRTLVKAGAVANHKSEMIRLHGGDEKEIFSALTPEEQQTLAELLNRQLNTWEADHAAHHQH